MSDESTKGPERRQKVRRVRVIEYIDDVDTRDEDAGPDEEELEEVLAEAGAAGAGTRTRANSRAAKAAETEELAGAEDAEFAESAEDEVEEEAEDEAAPRRSARTWESRPARPRGTTTRTSRGPRRAVRRVVSSPRMTTGLVVALVVVLGGLAFWQWRTASALAAEQDERQAVAKVAGEYGNTAFSYDASTYEQSIQANLKLLGGDLLSGYKKNTVPNLPNVFKKNPELQMSSKIKSVYVGDINGDIATAVILVDVSLRTPEGTNDGSDALLRLGLKRENGAWKITDQRASGQGDGESAAGGISGIPGGTGASPAPSDKKDDKKD